MDFSFVVESKELRGEIEDYERKCFVQVEI